MRSLEMTRSSFRKLEVADMERQGPKNNGTTDSEQKTTKEQVKTFISLLFNWDVAFLVVRVVGVAVDLLFLYLPVINEATNSKCITIDNKLKIIAICARSFLDLVAFGDMVAHRRVYTRSDYVINILGILPVPQVLLPIIPKMSRSKSWNLKKFLTAVVVSQYVPRIFSIYRLWRKFNKNINASKTTRRSDERLKNIIVMKAFLNLYLYLVASHVLGAFWYFIAIGRETTCWELACEHDIGCSKTTSLDCDDGFRNYTILNDYCSIEKPNTTLFHFGIFQEARQSGILTSMDFPQKNMYSFWWGLRNLSSLGQNLETSPDFWENCFAVLISIFGLLLFLYFIGNLQVYMQWQTSNELDEAKRLEGKEAKRLEDEEAKRLQEEEAKRLQEEEAKRLLEEEKAKRFEEEAKRLEVEEALPLLRTVPIFEHESVEFLYEITRKFLKKVHFNQSSYIVREGEPLDALIFVVKGIAWTYTSNHDNKTKCLKTGDLFGRRLVDWALKSPELSDLPLSTRTLKCHTKIEAFYLMASDLKGMMSQYWWKYSKLSLSKDNI